MALVNLTSLFFLLFLSCSQGVYDMDRCDELSMSAFKGSPKSANEFKENCQDIEIYYTHNLCQSALQKLVMGTDMDTLEKEFGEKIGGCFSENDLKKFLRNEGN